MENMHKRNWIFCSPVFIIALVGCTAVPSQKIAIASSRFEETQIPLPSSTEVDPPTQLKSWYSHPIIEYDLPGKDYVLLKSSKAPIYNTLEDAVNHKEKHWLAPEPPAYLAYDKIQTVDGESYVQLTERGWMSQEELEPVTPSSFSGMILSEVPDHPFGWVIRENSGWIDPEGKASSGKMHNRYDVVLDLEEKNGYIRLETGDWILAADLRLVDLKTLTSNPPVTCRWLDVDLSGQILAVFENCLPVFATLISSAKAPAVTPQGVFSIFYKEESLPLYANERSASSEAFYLSDVPWLMFYHANWAIHGAYWHDHFGEPWSHGCINVSPYDARWLYEWTKLGDMIVIHE
jgi:hypothetical protein